jgi:hypothetical protein
MFELTLASLFNRFSALASRSKNALAEKVKTARETLAEAEKAEKALKDTTPYKTARETLARKAEAEKALAEAEKALDAETTATAIPETDLIQTTVYTAPAIETDYKQSELQTLANKALGITAEQITAGKNASIGQYGYPRRFFNTWKRLGGTIKAIQDDDALVLTFRLPGFFTVK